MAMGLKTLRQVIVRRLTAEQTTQTRPKRNSRGSLRGTRKPEPLKYLAPNTWSRRLTQEHRIVYLVQEERVVFLQGRYHYQ